jgi:hypothetical protein
VQHGRSGSKVTLGWRRAQTRRSYIIGTCSSSNCERRHKSWHDTHRVGLGKFIVRTDRVYAGAILVAHVNWLRQRANCWYANHRERNHTIIAKLISATIISKSPKKLDDSFLIRKHFWPGGTSGSSGICRPRLRRNSMLSRTTVLELAPKFEK